MFNFKRKRDIYNIYSVISFLQIMALDTYIIHVPVPSCLSISVLSLDHYVFTVLSKTKTKRSSLTESHSQSQIGM